MAHYEFALQRKKIGRNRANADFASGSATNDRIE
jgi:hypothetical protein